MRTTTSATKAATRPPGPDLVRVVGMTATVGAPERARVSDGDPARRHLDRARRRLGTEEAPPWAAPARRDELGADLLARRCLLAQQPRPRLPPRRRPRLRPRRRRRPPLRRPHRQPPQSPPRLSVASARLGRRHSVPAPRRTVAARRPPAAARLPPRTRRRSRGPAARPMRRSPGRRGRRRRSTGPGSVREPRGRAAGS